MNWKILFFFSTTIEIRSLLHGHVCAMFIEQRFTNENSHNAYTSAMQIYLVRNVLRKKLI